MDGEPWMEHLRAMLQGSGTFKYDETELEVLETSLTVDTKYLAVGFTVSVYGETCLDFAPLRRIHNGESFWLLHSLTLTVFCKGG